MEERAEDAKLPADPEGADDPAGRVERWIAAAGNVANPCLGLLRTQGYELGLDEAGRLFQATKGDLFFSALFPEELLGLVRLVERGAPMDGGASGLREELWERAIPLPADEE